MRAVDWVGSRLSGGVLVLSLSGLFCGVGYRGDFNTGTGNVGAWHAMPLRFEIGLAILPRFRQARLLRRRLRCSCNWGIKVSSLLLRCGTYPQLACTCPAAPLELSGGRWGPSLRCPAAIRMWSVGRQSVGCRVLLPSRLARLADGQSLRSR